MPYPPIQEVVKAPQIVKDEETDTYTATCECGSRGSLAPTRKRAKQWADAHRYEHAEGVVPSDDLVEGEGD